MSPVLSVVVPAYNVAEYLPACLDSLLNQTLRDLEVIVVDDGSPDECGEIADSYAARDERVVVLHTDNQGLGPARNTGMQVARGTYLTFVDSDDLVPSRAFELMVNALEGSGSDFAAGNAWRYMPDGRLLPSWTHQEAFAEDRTGVTIHEFPLLARDRMVWNKVWRRSFWDAHGFEFPAIRYEDYPVTLAAHLVASGVDVLSSKVYLWRQRRESTSITQRSADIDNVADRVRSAELVLDQLGDADPTIRDAVHAYLVDVDLVAVADAYTASADGDGAAIGALLRRLATRLSPRGTTPIARSIHSRARRGRLQSVAALGRLRAARGASVKVKALLRPRMATALPRLLAAGLGTGPARASRALRRRLRSDLTSVRTTPHGIELDVRLRLRESLAGRARLGATVDGRALELRRSGARDVTITIPRAALGESSLVALRARLGPLRWAGTITVDEGAIPRGLAASGTAWLAFGGTPQGGLTIGLIDPAVSADIDLTDVGLQVDITSRRLDDGDDGGLIAVLRGAPTEPLVAPLSNSAATIPWGELLAGDPPDNPATGQSRRPLVHVAPGHEPVDGGRPVFSRSEASVVLRDHTVSLERGVDGSAELLIQHHSYG